MRWFGWVIVGLVIGAAASWGYMYTQLQPALQRAAQAESSRDETAKAAKTLEDQLKEAQQRVAKLQSASKAAEQSIEETKDQLASALSGKQAAEKALSELEGQLSQAVSARETAEQALAEAKKTP